MFGSTTPQLLGVKSVVVFGGDVLAAGGAVVSAWRHVREPSDERIKLWSVSVDACWAIRDNGMPSHVGGTGWLVCTGLTLRWPMFEDRSLSTPNKGRPLGKKCAFRKGTDRGKEFRYAKAKG